jgi:hypothetical protein
VPAQYGLGTSLGLGTALTPEVSQQLSDTFQRSISSEDNSCWNAKHFQVSSKTKPVVLVSIERHSLASEWSIQHGSRGLGREPGNARGGAGRGKVPMRSSQWLVVGASDALWRSRHDRRCSQKKGTPEPGQIERTTCLGIVLRTLLRDRFCRCVCMGCLVLQEATGSLRFRFSVWRSAAIGVFF